MGLSATCVAALMRDASKSTTYKPALLKALARLAHRDGSLRVPLTNFGEEFVRLYWDQTVIYHLRQAAVLSKEATAVKLIRATALEHGVRKLSDLPAKDRDRLISKAESHGEGSLCYEGDPFVHHSRGHDLMGCWDLAMVRSGRFSA